MLLALQFPFADARPFLTGGPSRLKVPSWPIPITVNQFVRCFGPINSRARGAPVDGVWSQDYYFASANAAIKFPDLGTKPIGPTTANFYPRCAFRRLFCDGGPVNRVEIGLAFESNYIVDGKELLTLVRDVLKLETAVTQWESEPQKQPLVRQGASLAKLYSQTTTRTIELKQQVLPENYVWAGFPVIVIEYENQPAINLIEISNVPAHSNIVDPDTVGGLSVGHVSLGLEGKNVGIWMIGHTEKNRDAARRLRLCLLRLSAEYQVLSQILRWKLSGLLQYKPNTPEGDRLEEYFNRATHIIFQKTRNGVDQESVHDVMAAYEWVVNKSERDVLLNQFDRVRRQVKEKLERFVTIQSGGPKNMYVDISGDITNAEVTIMGTGPQQTVNIDYGQGNTFNGDAIAAGYIKDSFNKALSESKTDVQEALINLTNTVATMVEKLDADTQSQTAKKLKMLTEEATEPKPDKSTLEFSGKGLIEAAKTVADMVGPVTTAVKGVLALFGILL